MRAHKLVILLMAVLLLAGCAPETAPKQEGVLTVCTLNDSLHNSSLSEFKHTANTITEQAFDIFTIDFKNHKIYSTRIGCGEDRVFEYTTI